MVVNRNLLGFRVTSSLAVTLSEFGIVIPAPYLQPEHFEHNAETSWFGGPPRIAR
jgi:hypothetical protein